MERIILDKSALQGLGGSILACFFESRIALLPEMLFYEIVTESRSPPGGEVTYLDKIKRLQPCNVQCCIRVQKIVESEFRTGVRFVDIVDAAATQRLRGALSRTDASFPSVPQEEVACFEREQRKWVDERIAEMRKPRLKCVLDEVRRIVKHESCEFFQAYLRLRSDEGMDIVEAAKSKVRDKATGCGAPESVSPNRGCISLEFELLKNSRVLRCLHDDMDDRILDAKVANYLNDLEYVALLCRADGFLCGDGLLLDMARAFYPQASLWHATDAQIRPFPNKPEN